MCKPSTAHEPARNDHPKPSPSIDSPRRLSTLQPLPAAEISTADFAVLENNLESEIVIDNTTATFENENIEDFVTLDTSELALSINF